MLLQHLVLDNDCCISRNVGKTKIDLVMSSNLYFLQPITKFVCYFIGVAKNASNTLPNFFYVNRTLLPIIYDYIEVE